MCIALEHTDLRYPHFTVQSKGATCSLQSSVPFLSSFLLGKKPLSIKKNYAIRSKPFNEEKHGRRVDAKPKDLRRKTADPNCHGHIN